MITKFEDAASSYKVDNESLSSNSNSAVALKNWHAKGILDMGKLLQECLRVEVCESAL